MKKINNPHDRFFKKAMSDIRVACDFFRQHLPAEILAVIDFSTLRLAETSFITQDLEEFASDLLYSVSFAGRPGFLSVMVEHQSTPKPWMPVRILNYMVKKWFECIEQGQKKLPVIYPLVFYHGKVSYPYSTNIFELFDDPLQLAQRFLFKPFQLIDITTIKDEEVKRYVWAGVMQLILKHIHADDIVPYLRELISNMSEIDKAHGLDYLEVVVKYLNNSGSFKNEQAYLKALQQGLSPQTGAKIMTIAEHFVEKGRHEGWQAGRDEGWQAGQYEGWQKGAQYGQQQGIKATAKRMLQAGCDRQLIADVTGLSAAELASLAEEVEAV